MSEEVQSERCRERPQKKAKKIVIPSKAANFLAQEGVVIALLTGVGFYATFKFKESYLRYFGIGDIFIEIDAAGMIVATSAIAFVIVTIYHFSNILPLGIIRVIAEALFVYPYIVVPGMIFAAVFSGTGYSNTSMILLVYILISTLISAWILRKKMRKGAQWNDIVSESIDFDNQYRSQLLGGRLVDGPYGTLAILAIAGVFLSSAIATWAGYRAASNQRDYPAAIYEESTYALVGSYRDGLIGVELLGSGDNLTDGISQQLSGNFRIFQTDEMENEVQLVSIRTRIDRLALPMPTSLDWVSLSEFYSRIGRLFGY